MPLPNKVLVVGGAGYVGSVVVSELLAVGFSVRVLDRFFFGRDALEGVSDRIEIINADMREVTANHVAGCGYVLNLGGLSNDPTAEFNPRANAEINTEATTHVAEIARDVGVRRYVFASTCSIYDRGVGDDAQDVLQDEDSEVAPKAAYATSKLAAEHGLLPMASDAFCPIILRKGTIFGFSPRMRYDLVVNTFVKDALSKGRITIHFGGAMWRPMVEIRDVARAYVVALQAPRADVCGQIFNISAGNFRVSEIALRVQQALREIGVPVEIDADFGYRIIRSYRVANTKASRVLGFQPKITIEESAVNMAESIHKYGFDNVSHPRYYNIEWMKLLEQTLEITAPYGYVLNRPAGGSAKALAKATEGKE